MFTHLTPLSIKSSNQIKKKVLRQSVAFLKQSLEDGDVKYFGLIEGKDIVADVLIIQRDQRERC